MKLTQEELKKRNEFLKSWRMKNNEIKKKEAKRSNDFWKNHRKIKK
jgi:hypothetical protein